MRRGGKDCKTLLWHLFLFKQRKCQNLVHFRIVLNYRDNSKISLYIALVAVSLGNLE